MAEMSDKRLVEYWQKNLGWAHAKYKDMIEPEIDRNLQYYRGNHYPDLEDGVNPGYDYLTINKVYNNVKIITAAINIRDPRAYVRPRRKPTQQENTQIAAQKLEIVLNYFVRELNLRQEVTRVLVDASIMPWGIMKLGFMPEIEKIADNNDLLVMHEYMKPSWPFWTRWSPRHFRMDPEVDRIEEARWVAFYRLEHIEDLRSNPAMTVPRDLKPTASIKSLYGEGWQGLPVQDDDANDPGFYKRVGVWEIWDRKKGKLIEITGDSKKTLRHENWPYVLDGFPCVMLYFNINPDEQVPIADVSVYRGQQDELNRVESLMLEHIKRHLPITVVAEGALDPEQFDNMKRGEIGKIVTVKAVGNIKEVIGTVQGAQLSPDIHAVRNMLSSDLDELSTVSEMDRGSALRVDTATEAAIIQAAASLRREDRRTTLQAFVTSVMRIFRQILQQTMQETIDINPQDNVMQKILGADAAALEGWLTISKEDIQGEFSEEVEVGSSEMLNQALKKRDAAEDLTLLSGRIEVNQRELIRDYYEAKGKRDYDRLLYSAQQVKDIGQAMQGAQGAPGAPGGGGQPVAGLAERLGRGSDGLTNALQRIGG